MKAHINVSVENQLVERAKKEGINISRITEEAVIHAINHKEIDKEVYPEDYAEKMPADYWMAPDGSCRKRGQPLFFINDLGNIRPVGKEAYLLHLGIVGKGRYDIKDKSKISKKDSVVMEGATSGGEF